MRRLAATVARSTLARFLVAGGVSYVVNQALLVALYDGAFASLPRGGDGPAGALDWPLLLASTIALEVSVVVRFALNDRWTFRDRHTKSFAARFYQTNFTSFGSPLICLAAVNVLTPLFGVSYLLSNSLGVLLGLAWNWFWSVRLVWVAGAKTPGAATGRKWAGPTAGVVTPATILPKAAARGTPLPYATPLRSYRARRERTTQRHPAPPVTSPESTRESYARVQHPSRPPG